MAPSGFSSWMRPSSQRPGRMRRQVGRPGGSATRRARPRATEATFLAGREDEPLARPERERARDRHRLVEDAAMEPAEPPPALLLLGRSQTKSGSASNAAASVSIASSRLESSKSRGVTPPSVPRSWRPLDHHLRWLGRWSRGGRHRRDQSETSLAPSTSTMFLPSGGIIRSWSSVWRRLTRSEPLGSPGSMSGALPLREAETGGDGVVVIRHVDEAARGERRPARRSTSGRRRCSSRPRDGSPSSSPPVREGALLERLARVGRLVAEPATRDEVRVRRGPNREHLGFTPSRLVCFCVKPSTRFSARWHRQHWPNDGVCQTRAAAGVVGDRLVQALGRDVASVPAAFQRYEAIRGALPTTRTRVSRRFRAPAGNCTVSGRSTASRSACRPGTPSVPSSFTVTFTGLQGR